MLYRIEAGPSSRVRDNIGIRFADRIRKASGLNIREIRTVKVFTLDGISTDQAEKLIRQAALHDPVLQEAALTPLPIGDADWIIEVGFRPGVTDNEGKTARNTAALVLGLDRGSLAVYTSVQYRISGSLSADEARMVADRFLCNGLIQRCDVKSREEWLKEPGFTPKAAKVTGSPSDTVETVPLLVMNDEQLLSYSREHTLSLSLEEMRIIRDHFADPQIATARSKRGLASNPTDAEIEVLAQTWSEHCKHKIFAARIDYQDLETGRQETIDSLYKTCIRDTTATIRENLGTNDFCRSVFSDNAGVVAFNDTHDVCIKVETHNSPSALDPYGGALTGIVGVNRDPMGTGLGAELVCNTDVFCFASPFHEGELPPRLLHPARVFEGVREGVEHGGNKSGVPTVNGSVVFDERYLGKPLVYCGTVGLIPREVPGKNGMRKGYEKKAMPGDIVVMTGGRIGKDGIHGATFSSEELHEGSPVTAVQIGDPITQRKMYDFIMKARDLGLYNAITDNGAGGLSSSVGEMAEDTNGCRIDLAKAPLKYDGLAPWEILISEAQERMTLAVPPENIDRFMELAAQMDVEATALGEFTDSGFFDVTFGDKTVACLNMDFMHGGLPQYHLKAVWKKPEGKPLSISDASVAERGISQRDLLLSMLGRLNICSKEYIIRQYDHEVRGGSVVKPLTGVKRDAPSDAGVMRPILESDAGIVLSHGICPKYSDFDTYDMMANAFDEGIRNAVATGADPDRLAGVDNFCWCDPVQSEKTPDGEYKLAQLVRACQALSDCCLAYGVPCISGKDSMKNDYTGGGVKISIPPTVLFSVLGVIDDVKKTVTSDFKRPGNLIYLIGGTARELGGSEISSQLELEGGCAPKVHTKEAVANYRKFHKAVSFRLAAACHDLSDGGLGIAAAEMCIGGRIGATVNLDDMPTVEADLSATECLYSESAGRLLVEVNPNDKAQFEAIMGKNAVLIGETHADPVLNFTYRGSNICSANVEELAKAFKTTLAR
ncbi:MAG: AIR synthase-related protein [Desulfovibrionaceae bacterium]|nr:AIR synthase-related protein [Desulfovibrionaceae bacterium]